MFSLKKFFFTCTGISGSFPLSIYISEAYLYSLKGTRRNNMLLGGNSWTQLGGLGMVVFVTSTAEVTGLCSRCNIKVQMLQGLGKTLRWAPMNVRPH